MDYEPRIPVDQEYVSAIGRAAYNFAYLEWGVIWLAERLSVGYINTLDRKTAGTIADEFENLVASHVFGDALVQTRANALAACFKTLVVRRNHLLHGKPFTAPNGNQRLLYSSQQAVFEWKESDVIAAAKDFESAAIEANDLFHNHIT